MDTPKTLPGEPEAGVQSGMFGGSVEYHPKGAGRKVQVSMDEQLRLAQLRESTERRD
jgi:hypothetical protein